MHSPFAGRLSTLSLMVCLPVAAIGQQAAEDGELEEIRVTGHPINQSPEDLAQSVTVVQAEALDRARSSNLGETLAGQLGVSSSYFGAGASRPIIRGLGGARVRTMEDGIDSLDISTVSVDHAVTIDPLVAEQIEIFRGPTTLLYGSGAVGGIINTVTNRIPEFAPDDGFEGAFELRGDSAANERAGAFALDGGGDSFAWHVDGLTRETDDYEIPGAAELEHDEEGAGHEEPGHEPAVGFVENSDIEADSLAVGGSWLGTNGSFGVSVSSFATNYGIPGHAPHHEEGEPAAAPGAEEAVRIDLEQTRIDVDGGWLGFDGPVEAINLRVGVNDYRHIEVENGVAGTRFDNEAYEGRLEFLHAPWGDWDGAFGLQFGQRQFSAVGEEAFIPPVDTTSYGLFAIERRDAGDWQWSTGARVEWQEQAPSSGLPTVSDTATSLSLAGIRTLGSDYAFAVNIAVAERLPVAEELYADGPHLASGSIEVGDPTIGVETSRHLDVGLRKTAGDVRWSLTVFATSYADFIYLQNTGLEDPVEELPIFRYSQQDADFSGLEAEIFAPIASLGAGEVDVRVFADYVVGELDDGEYLPRLPPLRFGSRIQYHDDRFVAGLEVSEYDEQDKTAAFEEPTDGYAMLNADFSWRIMTSGGTQLDLLLKGSNLLDEDARRHTSLVKDTTPLPGRNYALSLRASF